MSMADNQRNQGQRGRGNKQRKQGDRDWPETDQRGLGSQPQQDRERIQGSERQEGQNAGNTGNRQDQNR
jgi:hypothetical protein